MRKLALVFFLATVFLGALVGCNTEEGERQESFDPVSLSILNWNGLTEEEFEMYLVKTISEKLPHISLTLINKESGTPADAIAKHVMGGNFPDLIYVSNKDINHFIISETVHNLEELVKTYNMDLTRFIPPAIESVKKKEVGLASIPWAQNVAGLLYNQDIFDQFGVNYPKDLMTWGEVSVLARTLTRMVDNEQYIGFRPSSLSQFGQSLSVSYVSPDGKALVDTPIWHQILNYYKSIFEIPGYENELGSFFGTKTVAMEPLWLGTVLITAGDHEGMRWDITGLPNFEERLGIGREVDAHTLAISVTSEHKEQAFQIIKEVTSDEVQSAMSRNGRVPVLDDDAILFDYGKDNKHLSDKNWPAVFNVTPGELREHATAYDSLVLRLINPLSERIRAGESDINTLLREIQEEADLLLQAEYQD